MLILLLLILALFGAVQAAPPTILLPAGAEGWVDPVFSPDGRKIAFTTVSRREIRVLDLGEDSARLVAQADLIGRRYVFEPNSDRIVYRQRAAILPGLPERLVSASPYLYDPVMPVPNTTGNIFGPYFISGKVWYRPSLLSPLVDYDGSLMLPGPYLDPSSGSLWVRNEKGDTVHASPPGVSIIGAEISPDAHWIAAVQNNPSTLLIVRVEDGRLSTIPHAYAPSWAGNSQSLICVRSDSGSADLLIVHMPDAESETVYSSRDLPPSTPALSPDGKQAVFVSKGALYELDLDNR
jgi:hypothetical protein